MGAGGEIERVWRYLGFSRFAWLLQNRQLWLCRLDLLGDAWEGALAGEQLDHVIGRHPPSPLSGPPREDAWERSERIIKLWRQTTFASCWSASEHKSHALWRIYCGANEGVAIQTTLDKLTEFAGNLSVQKIEYGVPGSKRRTPTRLDLATKKRPMYEFEREVRIIKVIEGDGDVAIHGQRLDWDPEKWIDHISVHPEASGSFLETVTAMISTYAPALKVHVNWSAMREVPPLDVAPGLRAGQSQK